MKESIKILGLGAATFAAAIAIAFATDYNRTLPASVTPEEVSWLEFCRARGYDPARETPEMTDEWLDTWCGSVEEEEALTRKGVQS